MKFELNLVALLALASSAIASPMRVGIRQLHTTVAADTDSNPCGSPANSSAFANHLGYRDYLGYGDYFGYGGYFGYGTYATYGIYSPCVEEAAKAAREANPDALPNTAPVKKREPARAQDFESHKDYGS
jgi:hypothetical protein